MMLKCGPLWRQTKAESKQWIYFFISTDGENKRRGTVSTRYIQRWDGTQNLLIQFDEKWLQLFDHVNRMETTWILRRSSELNFKGNKSMRCPRIWWFGQVLENIMKRGKGQKKLRKEKLWEKKKDWRHFVYQPI